VKVAPRYNWLVQQVDLLQSLLGPKMGIRYENLGRSVEEAVSAIHASLFLCSTLATMWNFDHLRGSKHSLFKPGCFYKNGTRSNFYCKRLEGDLAVLILFQQNKWTGSQLLEMSVPTSASSLYLEVKDEHQDQALRVQFTLHLRNPGRRVTPEEIGLKYTASSDGLFMTSSIKRPKKTH